MFPGCFALIINQRTFRAEHCRRRRKVTTFQRRVLKRLSTNVIILFNTIQYYSSPAHHVSPLQLQGYYTPVGNSKYRSQVPDDMSPPQSLCGGFTYLRLRASVYVSATHVAWGMRAVGKGACQIKTSLKEKEIKISVLLISR